MVDLETLGNRSDSVILSIGAVSFDKELEKEFYRKVNLQSSLALGFDLDANTILWWLQQNLDARKELYQDAEEFPTIYSVLIDFSLWLQNKDEVKLWGNGSDFDNVILTNAYQICKLTTPWKFFNNRCYRTMKNLCSEIKIERISIHHNALDDARNQALHLIEIFKAVKK